MRLRQRMAAEESTGTLIESRTLKPTLALPWSILTLVTLPTTTPATLTPDWLEGLDVASIQRDGDRVRVLSNQPEEVLWRLHAQGMEIRDLNVTGADLEEAPHAGQVALDHVAEVVAGGEHGPLSGQHDNAGVARAGHTQGIRQLLHVRFRERVSPLGAIHDDRRDAVGTLVADIAIAHRAHLTV